MASPDQAEAVTSVGRLPTLRALADWQHGGFGVYVHWPFCLAKCPYCDFNSHVSRNVDQTTWRDGLLRETAHMRSLTGARSVDTVFFGGGTPSLMAPETVAAVIEQIDRLWGLVPDAEISLEANPTSVEAAKFRDYATAGVNRVSMGVQALNDADLKALGRMHSVAEAEAAFGIARSVFERVSFDLIYARVGQGVAAWEAELRCALDMAVDHLSLYQLTIEPGTRFAELYRAGKLHPLADAVSAEMYEVTQALCEAAGMPAYEISNHARPGAESRHNRIYWRYGDYVGIGPGAHGRITTAGGARHATETLRDPATWLSAVAAEGHAVSEQVVLPMADQASEYALMSLRLSEGMDLGRFEGLAGAPMSVRKIEALEASGHLVRYGNRLCATADGRIVLNTLLAELLS